MAGGKVDPRGAKGAQGFGKGKGKGMGGLGGKGVRKPSLTHLLIRPSRYEWACETAFCIILSCLRFR